MKFDKTNRVTNHHENALTISLHPPLYATPDYHESANSHMLYLWFQNQWETHHGKCGVCGDPWQGPKENEAGGKYSNRIISRMYEQGSVATMVVDLTSNHLGYFEFRLCPNNNFSRPVTQSCLDTYLLRGIPSDIGRHAVLNNFRGKVEFQIKLPPMVTCSQCIIQWKYHCGKWRHNMHEHHDSQRYFNIFVIYIYNN